jgi:glycosyltransferase involved in cell wall biosynthesis
MKKIKAAVIVPEYNENIRAVRTVRQILRVFDGLVIVVDDGSKDNSFELIRSKFRKNHRVEILKHKTNLGKGAAMRSGVEKAWILGFNAVIFIDADGQHNPKYVKKFLKKLEEYPIVFGYRVLSKKMPMIRRWGNIVAAKLVNTLFNIKKKDLLSGYLAFRKDVYDLIKWKSQRYGIETEMATKVGRNKIPFFETRIDTIYIDKYKGVNLLDSMKVLSQIPYWYFESNEKKYKL